tara:strand:+ start:52 stop:519 length:468 start_codon:yes stop_codon:yes gene_type:complete
MPKTLSTNIIKKTFPSYFSADYIGLLDEAKIKQILKIYSKKEGGRTLIAKKLKLDQSVVGRILVKAEKNNLIKRVQRVEFKTTESQKIYENIEDRYIYLKVRQITSIDRKLNLNIPKYAKFKIQLPTGKHAPSTIVKYYYTKQEAEIAKREWKKK